MKLRLLPLLWMVWVPLFSPGALPQPAVVAAAADVAVVATYPPTATKTMATMSAPIQGAESLRRSTAVSLCGSDHPLVVVLASGVNTRMDDTSHPSARRPAAEPSHRLIRGILLLSGPKKRLQQPI